MATCAAVFALLGSVTTLCACEQSAKKEEPKPSAPAAAAPKPAAVPSTKPKPPPVKLLEWDDPKQWKKVQAGGMRAASYQIPPAPGDKEIAELNVFVLGGDIESNIQRWIDEFSGFDPKTLSRSDRVVNDMSQAVVEVPKGTFSGGMGENSKSEDFGLLGAIVVTPEDSKYFFKLTGPSATVKGAREPFYQLLDSVRLQGGTAAPGSAKTVKSVGGANTPPSNSVVDPGSASVNTKPGAPTAAPAAKH